MNLFLDANILVSVLNKEYPSFSYTSRIVSLADRKGFFLYTSPVCLAIAFYFSEKKSGRKLAREKLALLTGKIRISAVDEETVRQTMANRQIHDLEDGFEYYAARASSCAFIITENKKDFYFSDIEVCHAKEFVETKLFAAIS